MKANVRNKKNAAFWKPDGRLPPINKSCTLGVVSRGLAGSEKCIELKASNSLRPGKIEYKSPKS